MREGDTIGILDRLDRLRAELIESAYALDTRGQHQAADIAMTTSARLGELCAEFAARPQGLSPADPGSSPI